jgi:hypothetical protein
VCFPVFGLCYPPSYDVLGEMNNTLVAIPSSIDYARRTVFQEMLEGRVSERPYCSRKRHDRWQGLDPPSTVTG